MSQPTRAAVRPGLWGTEVSHLGPPRVRRPTEGSGLNRSLHFPVPTRWGGRIVPEITVGNFPGTKAVSFQTGEIYQPSGLTSSDVILEFQKPGDRRGEKGLCWQH